MNAAFKSSLIICLPLILALLCRVKLCSGQSDIEGEPIQYSKSEPSNAVTRLIDDLGRRRLSLVHDERTGFLNSLLEHLEIPLESQLLVFSKTSMQRHRISARAPRAIYFNDETFVGYCLGGEVIEISTSDPKLGTVFYTLDQTNSRIDFANPPFARQTDNCLICHSNSRTSGVPGHVVRSLFVQRSGQPVFSAGSDNIDDRSPFDIRWGGWYVTGRHGQQKHRGNLIIDGNQVDRPVENERGQNVEDLSLYFETKRHQTPHSDIVALMVFEHQTHVHNLLTKASYATRQAIHYEQEFNKAVGESDAPRRMESTSRRIENACEELVEGLLLYEEAELTDRVQGTSGFEAMFTSRGPFDSKKRSLREFDLQRRLFKYPCSYLIYSEAFDSLPPESKRYVWKRLWDVLAKGADAEKYKHLSPSDRQAIIEIIADTKTTVPDYWLD